MKTYEMKPDRLGDYLSAYSIIDGEEPLHDNHFNI